jgi:hypothetical protein
MVSAINDIRTGRNKTASDKPCNLGELCEKMPANLPFRWEHPTLFDLEARYKTSEPGVSSGQVVQLSSFVVRPKDAAVLLHFQCNKSVNDVVTHLHA